MSVNWDKLANTSLQKISPYTPGLIKQGYIKLASNENPLGPSPLAIAAIKKELKNTARYPDSKASSLLNALEEKYHISKNRLVLGNGSDELFRLICKIFLRPFDSIMFPAYSFAAYEICAHIFSAKPQIIPLKNWQTDCKAMLECINNKTKIIFLANPNNPIANWLSHSELTALLEEIPKRIIVVLDEAYYEYANGIENFPNALTLTNKYHNLVITRTFSKIYALSGIRIGYAIVQPELAEIINKIRLPFNINRLAQVAAIASIFDNKHFQKSINLNQQGKTQLEDFFLHNNLKYFPCISNFFTVNFGSKSPMVHKELIKNGIIVRELKNYNLVNYLRISIGTKKENSALINALSRILS